MIVAQLVRASDCGSEGRGFEPRSPPTLTEVSFILFRFVLGDHVFYIRDFLYVGHGIKLAGCKFLYVPS